MYLSMLIGGMSVNTFLFIIAFVITTIVILVFWHEIKDNNKNKKSALLTNIQSIARGITVFMASVAITDKLGMIDFGIYSGSYFFMGVVCIIAYILCAINNKHKLPVISHSVKVIFFAFILELTLFNCPVYRMWFGNYSTITCKAGDFTIQSGGTYRADEHDVYVCGGEELVLTIPEVNTPLSTVYVDMYLEGNTRAVDFWIDATDETQSFSPRERIAHTIVSRKQQQSHYLQCELSGNVGEVVVRLQPQNGGSAYVESITLNMPIAMEISWIRFLLIVSISVFIYTVIKEGFMKRGINENLKFCRISAILITTFMCICAIWVTNYRIDDRTWKEEFTKTSGNQVTQQLVDAFIDGRTYLYPQPDENLTEFDNPYDRQHREAELSSEWDENYSSNSAWDHVYFNGKFYSYYGIAPVILLFLPYHLITGYYFPDSAAVLIFAVIGMIGLSFMFTKFTKKFFPELPTGIFIISLIIIQMVSGVWYSIGRPLFYEIAMSAGFAFMTWAFYFLFSANIIGKGKISLSKTAISSLLFALSVLSRPTTVLYCICAAIFMIVAMNKFKDNENKKFLNKNSIRYLICAISPMACLGIIQMIYNYVRFDSPFEFGIQYSLTINDFRNAEFHWLLSLIPFWNYLFNTPVFSTEYPFISANFQDMGVGGFFYNDSSSTHNVCGLFFLALPMFGYLLSGKAIKTLPNRHEKIQKSLYILFPCIIIPLIIICSVWESGYSIRYMTDFAWQMLIGAYVIIFCLYQKCNEPIKKILTIFLCVSLVWTIIVSGVQSVNQAFRYCDMHWDYPEIAYEIKKIFMFWT